MRSSLSGRPVDLVLVVAPAARGQRGLRGVVARERLGLRAVVVAACQLLDRAVAVEHAPPSARRTLDPDLVLGAGAIAVARDEWVSHVNLLCGPCALRRLADLNAMWSPGGTPGTALGAHA